MFSAYEMLNELLYENPELANSLLVENPICRTQDMDLGLGLNPTDAAQLRSILGVDLPNLPRLLRIIHMESALSQLNFP